jgi:hypothetical protein
MTYRPELTKRSAGPIVNLLRMPHRPMPDRAVVAIPRSFADMILVCAGTPARRKVPSHPPGPPDPHSQCGVTPLPARHLRRTQVGPRIAGVGSHLAMPRIVRRRGDPSPPLCISWRVAVWTCRSTRLPLARKCHALPAAGKRPGPMAWIVGLPPPSDVAEASAVMPARDAVNDRAVKKPLVDRASASAVRPGPRGVQRAQPRDRIRRARNTHCASRSSRAAGQSLPEHQNPGEATGRAGGATRTRPSP